MKQKSNKSETDHIFRVDATRKSSYVYLNAVQGIIEIKRFAFTEDYKSIFRFPIQIIELVDLKIVQIEQYSIPG